MDIICLHSSVSQNLNIFDLLKHSNLNAFLSSNLPLSAIFRKLQTTRIVT